MTKYLAKIGLEMHCEVSETNTKVFSSAENSYKETPNANVRPIDMGFPGTLPVVNKEAVRLSLMASMILNCRQPEYMYFERKNYYYPDMPKNFQITQNPPEDCVGMGGYVDVYNDDDTTFRVGIDNIHLEEDAASLDHYYTTSNIDYNRAGVPLLELVTKPDLHNAKEAVLFLEHMRSIYQYAGISEADSKKGQIRCDVNISIMDETLDENDPNNWGTKVEIKNVNSFGGVRDAINYEIERQIDAKESGTYDTEIEQETRRWDEESGTTIRMRSKADAIDYKYFVEPNIPKYKITKEWLDEIRASIPELAPERKNKYINEYGLSSYDAGVLVKEKSVSDYFEETIKNGADPKLASNWLTSIILGYLNKNDLNISELYLTPNMLFNLISMVNDGKISSKQAKEVLYKSLEEKIEPTKIVEESGMKQIGSEEEIRKIIIEVLTEQPTSIEQYKSGKTNIVDFLVGQVMKKTRGQANPAMARSMMIEEIEKR